ncbi:hypothetical protein HPB48_000681 [Haemaphysalis longicornis]|uniref:Uncharacterized protein n=1 Tax=Haemaphysalis longicornis TaxID=44386 RepID=A0A9J6H5S3_HAELO|nr:hypothetical protein HPB48_000681 [Haemaphysalis longicornis]
MSFLTTRAHGAAAGRLRVPVLSHSVRCSSFWRPPARQRHEPILNLIVAMGCAPLKVPCIARRRQTGPLVDLVIGSDVRPTTVSLPNKKLIFVFGGPCSRKGQIVNDIASCFRFEIVSAEPLILAHFAKQLHSDDDSEDPPRGIAQRVEDLLKDDPSRLSLWLLLELLGHELDSRWEPGMVFLADPVPNLRYMLPNKRQLRRCHRDMQLFEERWPCLLALSLCVPESRLSIPARSSWARKLGDEKDIAKTKRRYQEYTESVQDLLHYFRHTNRLVTADVPHDPGLVSDQLAQYLASLGFQPRCTLDPNIVFVPMPKNKRRNSRAALGNIQMLGSPCISPVDKAEPSGCTCLDNIAKEAQQGLLARPMRLACQPGRRFFSVCWQQEPPPEDSKPTRPRVMFSGYERLGGEKPSRAVGTPLGETCLFPEGTDLAACRQVALMCARHLYWQCSAGPHDNRSPASSMSEDIGGAGSKSDAVPTLRLNGGAMEEMNFTPVTDG